MSLIAEYELDTPILVETRTAVPDLDFKIEDEFVSAEGIPILTAWAMGDESVLEKVDEVVSEDSTVRSVTLLADLGQRRLYRVELTPEIVERMTYPDAVEQGITILEIRGSGDRVRYRARVPDRDALTAYRQRCAERDLGFKLQGLYQGKSAWHETTTLTDRQREILRAAFEAGYFSVPRQTTLESLAAELDVSDQALSAILRRGQSNLLSETIASDLTPAETSDGT